MQISSQFIFLSLVVLFIGVGGKFFWVKNKQSKQPDFLYKILSLESWTASQKNTELQLTQFDAEFIHLSTLEQLDKIQKKFWGGVSHYIVLKLSTAKLQGTLKYEKNPGGETKYYHLYNGRIPLNAIVEAKSIGGPASGS